MEATKLGGGGLPTAHKLSLATRTEGAAAAPRSADQFVSTERSLSNHSPPNMPHERRPGEAALVTSHHRNIACRDPYPQAQARAVAKSAMQCNRTR